MIWFILGVLLVSGGIWFIVKDTAEGLILVPIGLAIMTVLLMTGLYTYPDLMSDKAYAESLYSEIETIKSAHYDGIPGGTLVGGSLDNLRQSTILSEYIQVYAKEKAKYNSNLARHQVRMSNGLYFWFQNTMFIDRGVMGLKKI